MSPSKSENSIPFTEGRKEVIYTTKKTLKEHNISRIPLSEENCWSSREKNLKTPTTGPQRIKTLTKNNSRCVNLNAEYTETQLLSLKSQCHH
jgi:hypothetical protein